MQSVRLTVVVGSGLAATFRYLAEDIDVFGWSLTAAEMQRLDAATEPTGGGKDHGPCLFCHD
jgi:diketogulonate reductase-like aldo/keto reductase